MITQLYTLLDHATLRLFPRLRIRMRWGALGLVVPLLMAMVGYLVVAGWPPSYQATATVHVSLADAYGLFNGPRLQIDSTELPQAMDGLIRAPVIAARADTALSRTYPGFRLSLSSVRTSFDQSDYTHELVGITVQDARSQRAVDAANAVASAFVWRAHLLTHSYFSSNEQKLTGQMAETQRQIQSLRHLISTYTGPAGGDQPLQTQLRRAQTSYASQANSLEAIRTQEAGAKGAVAMYLPASAPAVPIRGHPARVAAGLFLLGILLWLGLLWLYRRLHDLPRSVDEIAATAGARLLGTVERFDGTSRPMADVPSAAAEEYRMVRTSLLFGNREGQARAILVTSAFPGEGKSTTALNLARVFARGSGRTTLIDADLRQSNLHHLMPGARGSDDGLASLLASNARDVGVYETDVPHLAFVPAGRSVPSPADWLASPAMRRAVERFREGGMVIVDSPPVLSVPDAAILASAVDGVVLVIDPHRTSRRDIRRARQTIEVAGGSIIGVVVNRLEPGGLDRRGRFHRYGYRRRGPSRAA